PRFTCMAISARPTSFGMLNSSQPLFIFSQNSGFLRYSSLAGEKVFLPRQKPGLEKRTVSSMSKPTAIGARPIRLFSICATETQRMGACSARMAAVVPGESGGGAETRATKAVMIEHNEQDGTR